MAQPTPRRTHLIRAGTAADLDAISRIQATAPEASQWRPQDYLAYELWVAEASAGGLLGFAVARTVAPGEWELLNLAVAADCRRQGVAENLLRHLLHSHPGEWFLEVRQSNFSAQALYRKAGFEAVGERREYYADQTNTNREGGVVFRFRP